MYCDSRFVTRKWNIVNNQSNANYNVGNELIYNTEALNSNLCDYNDGYILVKGDITVIAAPTVWLKYDLNIVHHLVNVSQKLMEQQ